MKLAIIGSRAYTNRNRVEHTINKYVERYGVENLEIISGGCPNGGDFLAKDIALSKNLKYIEFPPIHSKYNCYCIHPPEEYNQPYHVSNFFSRNTQIAEYCEHLAAFVVDGVKANGTMDTVAKATKLNKIIFLWEDKK